MGEECNRNIGAYSFCAVVSTVTKGADTNAARSWVGKASILTVGRGCSRAVTLNKLPLFASVTLTFALVVLVHHGDVIETDEITAHGVLVVDVLGHHGWFTVPGSAEPSILHHTSIIVWHSVIIVSRRRLFVKLINITVLKTKMTAILAILLNLYIPNVYSDVVVSIVSRLQMKESQSMSQFMGSCSDLLFLLFKINMTN